MFFYHIYSNLLLFCFHSLFNYREICVKNQGQRLPNKMVETFVINHADDSDPDSSDADIALP